jgi:hypothetical protein
MSSNRFFFSAISSSSRRQLAQQHTQQTNNCLRRFSDAVARPKQPVSQQERAILRADRKERASQFIQKSKGGTGGEAGSSSSVSSYTANKYFWYGSVGVPSALLIWGFSDSNSPPAKFCNLIGLSGFVQQYTDQIAKPAHEKLLPDWSQVRT